MFVRENAYARKKSRSSEQGSKYLNVDGQRQWRVDEPSDAEGVSLPGRCIFAQNDAYLEICNPGWDLQWRAGIGNFFVVIPALLMIWWWFGFAIYPLISDGVIFFFVKTSLGDGDKVLLWMGWLLFFPLAIGCGFLLYLWFFVGGMRTAFFTLARGRIRFNRLKRKIYVLRPRYCGGNVVIDWDKVVALLKPEGVRRGDKETVQAIALYRPPSHGGGSDSDEDAIFVGPTLPFRDLQAAGMWEYIRRYMEEGPTVDQIPPNAPSNYKQIPRYLPQEYTTYCGKPSWRQYILEQKPGFMEASCHMMSQMTCAWPRFPKEWGSDSGLGEPEDHPVQTGAVMTAMVYRAQGRLSAEDNLEFLRRWGTHYALNEALSKAV